MRGRAGARLAAAVAAAALGAGAAGDPAGAAVRIGPERIVVEAPRARATIERRPLRLAFDDRRRPALRQVVNERPRPLVVPPSPDPEPIGSDNLDGPTLYSPFSFMVGRRDVAQFPATAWVGNLLAGFEAGVQHSARDVEAVRAERGGARLTVGTSDPLGRKLIVSVRPSGPAAIRVSARVTPSDGVATLADSFAAGRGDAFHGFGGRHNSLDQRGEDFYNWVEQQNLGAGPLQPIPDALPGSGGDRYLFPNGPTAAYYVQSHFTSQRYSFLLDRHELSGWRLASDRPDAWQVSNAAPALDYLVAPGGPRRSIGTLTEATGRHRPPPGWALGPQLDRLTRFSGETPETYKRAVLEDLDNVERHDLPLTAYRIEAWEFLERDFLRQVIERLHRRGIRALVYFRAFVGKDEIGTDDPADFDEAVEKGYVARTATGQPYVFMSNFNAPAAVIDFTNPEAVRWWRSRIHEALELGADGFMQDFGEQVLQDMRFANGETGATMHNRLPALFHRRTREAVDAWERSHPGERIWFFTRAGYNAAPRFEGGNFPGDETTDWSRSSGLASLATDMLNRSVGGAFGYGTDIGGYFDFHTPPTTKELFIRWAEWAALSPVFRLHGSINAGTHAPWTFDAETVEVYKRLSRLHMAASGYMARLWREGARTGIPPTRALWLAAPDEPAARRQEQEWLLGDDVLVAPVVEEGATGRQVYFPRGCWRHAESGERFDGPGSARVEAPLGRLPYFFRCGSKPF